VKNQVVIDGLRIKLNDISNAIRECEQQIAPLMADKATIHAALKVMGSDSNEGAVALGIQRGAFSRTILEVLRDAEPLSVRDIAAALMKKSGKDLDGHEFSMVVARVRNTTPRLSDRLDGQLRGRTTYWTIKPPG
jgi:hypothetical protein